VFLSAPGSINVKQGNGDRYVCDTMLAAAQVVVFILHSLSSTLDFVPAEGILASCSSLETKSE
jgi:hypothetical protein